MRLIILLVLFVIGIGFFLQAKIEVPYLQWLGHLPGDLVIHKGQATHTRERRKGNTLSNERERSIHKNSLGINSEDEHLG